MNRPFKLFSLGIVMTTLVTTGCREAKQTIDSKEAFEAHRAQLRAQVASGAISEAEAIVANAEATKELKSSDKGKKQNKTLSPELRILGEKLKQQVTSGELSEDDAKAKWMEATKKEPKHETPTKESKQPEK